MHDVLLSSSMVPFRVAWPHKAVLPITKTAVLKPAEIVHKPLLNARWSVVSALWEANRSATTKESLVGWLDCQGKLRRQLPAPPHRVMYTASGNRIAAAYTADTSYIIEHKLYWMKVNSAQEGRYLTAILNSDAVATAVAKRPSSGLFATRDIDLLPWRLAIPGFDASNSAHTDLATLGASAATEAEAVDLSGVDNFIDGRRAVRTAIAATSADIDAAVTTLLGL